MKHLRKFNESLDAKSDYILSVFANLQDSCDEYLDGDDPMRYEFYEGKLYVIINLPRPSKFGPGFDDYINFQKETLDVFEETKTCINKVKIEFPDIEWEYELGDHQLDKISRTVAYNHMYYFLIKFTI